MRDHLQTVLSITSAIWHDGAAETTQLQTILLQTHIYTRIVPLSYTSINKPVVRS